MLQRRIKGRRFGAVILTLAVAALAGCAGTRATPEPLKPAAVEETAPEGPVVERLPEGREGFVIRESSQMDAEARGAFDRAVALMEDGDYEEAVILLETVVETSPDVTAPYINLAIACTKTGRVEDAEAHLKTALEILPAHPVASNEYGLLLRRAGRFEEARAVYEKGISAFPEYLPLHRNLGILCDLYLYDLDCALEQYELYREAVPEDKDVEIWAADLRLRGAGGGQEK